MIDYKKYINKKISILFLILAVHVFGTEIKKIKLTIDSTESLLSYVNVGSSINISVNDFSTALGYKNVRDSVVEKLIMENDSLLFIRDIPFVKINKKIIQLYDTPILINGELFFSIKSLEIIFDFIPLYNLVSFNENHIKIEKIQFSNLKSDLKNSGILAEDSNNTPKTLEKQTVVGRKVKTIVIDPGHGGKDPGAIGPGGVMEKNVVLKIAIALKKILKDSTDIKVLLTRDKDIFIPLRNRTKFANDNKADLFISIHANSIGGTAKRKNSVKGYKVYFLSQAKNEADKLVAMKENSVIEMEDRTGNGNLLQNILIEMAANEYLSESQEMAIMISESFGNKLKEIGKLHTGVGQAPFWVLNGAYMPSVLVETAFISNSKEAKLLTSSKIQEKMAFSIFYAIKSFKKSYEAGL